MISARHWYGWLLVMALWLLPVRAFCQFNPMLMQADSFSRDGLELMEKGRYQEAVVYFEEAVRIRKEERADASGEMLNDLLNIGKCYFGLENFVTGARYYELALSVIGKALGEDSPDYIQFLSGLCSLFRELGNYAKTLEYNEKMLAIVGDVFGKDTPDYAAVLNDIALCHDSLGDYSRALECHLETLGIREKVLGKEHSDYATSLHNIGIVYLELGEYSKSLDCLQEALEIKERVLGKEHPDYAMSLAEVGNCLVALGNYTKALEYYQQAGEINERVSGQDSPVFASILESIGACHGRLGDYAKALDYHRQALVIQERQYGREHPELLSSLINIGLCLKRLGRYDEALAYYERGLTIQEKYLGKDHPNYAYSLNNVGSLFMEMGDYSRALACFEQALAITEKTLGKKHPEYAGSLYNIGSFCMLFNGFAKGSEFLAEYSEVTSSLVTSTFSFLTESQRALFWNQYGDSYKGLFYVLAVEADTPLMKRTAYNVALLGKGLLLNAETEMRKLILESGDEEALQMYGGIQESREMLDRLYGDPVGNREQIDSLSSDIEKRQQELMTRSQVFGDYTRNLALKWTDVQASLGKKDMAIEFGSYTVRDTTYYMALTLKPGYAEPHVVRLFNSTDLEQVAPRRYYTSSTLTDLVWGGLEDELKGVQNVYFSPSGELNNIGIEYLPDEDGKHLVSDKRNYYRLTSTRELVKDRSRGKMKDVTLYGGICYDVTPGSRLTGEESESERLALEANRSWIPLDSLSLSRFGWAFLPGTQAEAEAISQTLTAGRVKNVLLEGESGTEESFKSLSGAKKDVIHIATHGFYWTETDAARMGMETSSFMWGNEGKASKEDKALTRSGLLFAGAQNAFEGKDIPRDVEDGILTAMEISRMDLRGTDLVVISACQSGLGEVTGDGVFGLQRGFKKAGVQSIVMSLWEVDDEATRIMMTRFYENLVKGRSKYGAFREAQQYLRKYDDGLFDRPQYYAAFVLLDAID